MNKEFVVGIVRVERFPRRSRRPLYSTVFRPSTVKVTESFRTEQTSVLDFPFVKSLPRTVVSLSAPHLPSTVEIPEAEAPQPSIAMIHCLAPLARPSPNAS